MTAHRRAWSQRAGILLAAIVGMLGTVAMPAHAAPGTNNVTISVDTAAIDLQVGGPAKPVTFTVTNKDGTLPADVTFTLVVASGAVVTNKPQECTGGGGQYECTKTQIGAGSNWSAILQFGPNPQASVAPGKKDTSSGYAQINSCSSNQCRAGYTVNLAGPQQAPVVPSVSGVVKGPDGKPLSGADVAMQDSANHQFRGATNGAGAFTFTSTTANPITPGSLLIGAGMAGYRQTVKDNINGQAGQPVTGIVLTLALAPSASTSATASAVAPTDNPPAFTAGPAQVQTDSTDTAGNRASSGTATSFPWLPVLLGALLVLLGGGGIAYMLWRRKHDEDGDDEADADGPYEPRQPVRPGAPRAHGYAPDAMAADAHTRLSDPYADPYAAPPGPPTMVVGAGGMPRAMADAPTMLHPRQQADPYGASPGPYGAGAPRPPQPGYGPPPGSPAPGGYGPPGAGSGGPAYGAGRTNGGYGGEYDAPPPRRDADAYGAGGYGGAHGADNGYTQAAPYGGGGDSYGSRGYGDESRGGGYGGETEYAPRSGRQSGGYDEGYDPRGGYQTGSDYPAAGGYEPTGGGYPPAGGRDAGNGYEPGGYEPSGGYPRDGYGDRSTGYGDDRPAGRGRRAAPPDDRQRLDWLDD